MTILDLGGNGGWGCALTVILLGMIVAFFLTTLLDKHDVGAVSGLTRAAGDVVSTRPWTIA